MIDHQKAILGGIIPDRRDRLQFMLNQLLPDHFRVEYKTLYTLLERYYNMTGAIFSREVLSDLLTRNKVESSKKILYEEIFDELHELTVQEDEFRYAVDAIKDVRSEQLTGEAIVEAMEVLQSGKQVKKQFLKGHKDARDIIYDKFMHIDRLGQQAAPEGDIRAEAADMRAEYAARKSGKLSAGIPIGLDVIDNTTLGFQNGELIFIAAYTGEGKTTLCSQIAWYASVILGKNVFFATSETIRSQVRRKILSRHSRQPQFELPEGLNSQEIKSAKLIPEQEAVYDRVIEDMTTNPQYGKLHIAQVPRGATLGYIEARISRQEQNAPVDLVIVDYLALIKPEHHRQSKREELNDLIQDAKVMAATHADGRGVPLISPWAMSQSAWREAVKSGEYSLANLADTSEAEKSADVILSLLRFPDTPRELKLQFLKSRDSATPPPAILDIDYRTSYVSVRVGASQVSALLDDD